MSINRLSSKNNNKLCQENIKKYSTMLCLQIAVLFLTYKKPFKTQPKNCLRPKLRKIKR